MTATSTPEPEENKVDGKLPPVVDAVLETLQNNFMNDYEPVSKFEPGVIFKTTTEIYQHFYTLYPNPSAYDAATVATFLHTKGYTMKNMGDLRYEWMLKPTIL